MSALSRLAAPATFYPLAGRLVPWFAAVALVSGLAGLVAAYGVAPADAQQGEGYRILYVHVPASWLSMLLYCAMAGWSALGLALNTRLSHMMARAVAPTGAMFAGLSLVTGSLWGRPMWGTWWVWDARLTSELLLLLLYAGVIALQSAAEDPRRGDRAGALLALVGVVNVPVIYFSVAWWNTLHQGASITASRPPSMAAPMLAALGLMTLAFWAYAAAVVLARARVIVLERERDAAWIRHALA